MIRFVFIFLAFFSHAQAHEECLKVFDDSNLEEDLGLSHSNSSFSLTFQTALHKELSKTKILSPKEKKYLFKELEKSSAYIKSADLEQTDKSKRSARLSALEPLLMKALKKAPSIISFLENNQLPYLNKKQALEIIFISLTKYVRVYLSHPDQESDIDFKRFQILLSSIEAFDGKAFSIYKIIRAVRQKYSIYEYLNCI